MSDLNEIHKQARKEIKKLKEKYPDNLRDNTNQSKKEEYYESPYTMEDGTATFLYIVIMIVGTLFVDRWLIYTAATFIYVMFRTRHKRKK